MSTIESTLKVRGEDYGRFEGHAHLTQTLFRACISHNPKATASMTAVEVEALHMILHKIGRICNGNPHLHDSWHDIAGYATLVANTLLPPAPHPESQQLKEAYDRCNRESGPDFLRDSNGGYYPNPAYADGPRTCAEPAGPGYPLGPGVSTGTPQDVPRRAWDAGTGYPKIGGGGEGLGPVD